MEIGEDLKLSKYEQIGEQMTVSGLPPIASGYTINSNDAPSVVVVHHHHSTRPTVRLQRASVWYSLSRVLLALLEIGAVVIEALMLAHNPSEWFLFLWLLVLPLLSFAYSLTVIASGLRCWKSRDLYFGLMMALQVGILCFTYYGLASWISEFLTILLYANLGTCGLASFVHFGYFLFVKDTC